MGSWEKQKWMNETTVWAEYIASTEHTTAASCPKKH